MQAIQAIVDTYVRLRNEAALRALKQQRLKVLATCAPNDPLFAKLRGQCLDEISEIDAGLERLQPPPVVPVPPPSLPRTNAPPAKEARDHQSPSPPVIDPLSAPAAVAAPARPTPIDPSPFLAAQNASLPIVGVPSPIAPASEPPSIKTSKAPRETSEQQPLLFTASQVTPSLLASSLLAASLASKLPVGGDRLELELIRLQTALEQGLKSKA